jgi:NADPH:quinone reductase-like Zn-dependent oxidoreductase
LGGLESLHFLRQAHIRPGETVLINGAGGSIGTFGVQLAKYYGAEVTGVDRTEKLDMLRALGADHVVDYTREDFTRQGRTYDVIFDVVGKSKYGPSMRALNANGRYVIANPGPGHLARKWVPGSQRGKKIIVGTASYRTEDLAFLKELIEAGKLRAVIDRRFPLEQMVEAHRYVETGQKKGNLVIVVARPDAG